MEVEMRTNIVIANDLMHQALKLSGLSTKKEAVEQGLRLLIRVNRQQIIRQTRGKIKWTGNLHKMRLDR